MEGVKKIFFQIIPIALLLCFIAYGINAIFPDFNITYLKQNKIIVNGQYENYWHFDFETYLGNINFNYFTEMLTDLKAGFEDFVTIITNFGNIWKEGYKWGNVTKTIGNFTILCIDVILTPINLGIIILRLLSGIVLTLFSLVGISINTAETPITSFLRWITQNIKPIKYLTMVDVEGFSWKPVTTTPVII